jgi:hypothetical protein
LLGEEGEEYDEEEIDPQLPPDAVNPFTRLLPFEQRTVFDGVYVRHWEVMRFAVVTGKWFFGLFTKVEKLYPRFREGALEAQGIEGVTRGPGRTYRMKVRGKLGPRGSYGHRGICSHELHVEEILSCEETDDPGPTW